MLPNSKPIRHPRDVIRDSPSPARPSPRPCSVADSNIPILRRHEIHIAEEGLE